MYNTNVAISKIPSGSRATQLLTTEHIYDRSIYNKWSGERTCFHFCQTE